MNYVVTYEQELRGTHDGYTKKLTKILEGWQIMDLVENTNAVIILMQEVK